LSYQGPALALVGAFHRCHRLPAGGWVDPEQVPQLPFSMMDEPGASLTYTSYLSREAWIFHGSAARLARRGDC